MLKHSILIDEKLYNEIDEYCKVNGIKTSDFCNKELRKAIAIEKYGDAPFGKFIASLPSYEEWKSKMLGEPLNGDKEKELEKAITEFGKEITSMQIDLDPKIAQTINEDFWEMLEDSSPSIETVEETKEQMAEIMAVPSEKLNQNNKQQTRKRRL